MVDLFGFIRYLKKVWTSLKQKPVCVSQRTDHPIVTEKTNVEFRAHILLH